MLEEESWAVPWGMSRSFSREMGVGEAIWAEKRARAKAQKYEIAWCVLGAIQVIQHGLEQKIQGREFRGIWGMRRECCVILASHILCWGNEKQMGNMLPNMAQAWLSEKQERILFRFEEQEHSFPIFGLWPSFPIFGLWPTSFCDRHPRPRAGGLAHIFPILHKGGNGNETECPLYQSGLPHGARHPQLPPGMKFTQKSCKGPVKDTEGRP